MTRHVGTSEIKEKLASFLEEVESGEEIIITRAGRPVARLVPVRHHSRKEIQDAIRQIRALRKEIAPGKALDWRKLREEGRK